MLTIDFYDKPGNPEFNIHYPAQTSLKGLDRVVGFRTRKIAAMTDAACRNFRPPAEAT
ncbi:hypothetical protein [Bradyrhizobium sp. MOS002]|uniref:hypothetical protein n=1 Tax=Bradyrhizobium sp. MOS002 TaxID=2133947 RepID=UPI00130502A5|nr:hypothetical protein [Bradyrhizobium sp. MOS002]